MTLKEAQQLIAVAVAESAETDRAYYASCKARDVALAAFCDNHNKVRAARDTYLQLLEELTTAAGAQ